MLRTSSNQTLIRNLKIKLTKFVNVFIAVAVISSALAAGSFVNPNIAHASCDPRTEYANAAHVTPTVSVNQPTGTYDDPNSINISISGETAYTCEGPPEGGLGYQDIATGVNYRITKNSTGTTVFSNNWNYSASDCPNPLSCWPVPYNIPDVAPNTSTWEAGTYTITADVYDNTLWEDPPGPTDSDSKTFTITHAPGEVGSEVQGSLGFSSFNPNPADNTVTVSGNGVGGYWDRGGPLCYVGGRSHAYIRMQLVTTTPPNGPYPPGSSGTVNTAYHNQGVPNYPTTYKIDGNDAGTYPLALNYNGSDVPGDPNCETVPDPMGYSFSFPINTTGLSNGTHSVTVTAWDESSRSVISATSNFNVQHVQNVLNCGITQTVQSGTAAQYALSVSGNPTGSYSVTMSSNPGGPVMTNSPLTLNSGNSYTGTANVSTTGLAANTYHLTFSSNPASTPCTADIIVTPVPLPPQADVKFNGSDAPAPLSAGTTSGSISWSSQNAQSCSATSSSTPSGRDTLLSPSWNGFNISPLASGSVSVSGLQDGTSYTFNMHCNGAVGSNPSYDDDSVTVSVGTAPPPVPSVHLRCTDSQGGPKDGPCTVNSGSAAILSWSSSNTSGTCTITEIGGGQPLNSSGVSTGNLNYPPPSHSYVATCPGVAGSNPPTATSNTVVVNVTPPPATADLKCVGSAGGSPSDGPCTVNSGSSGTFSWTTSNASECVINQGVGTVPLPTGSQSTGTLNYPTVTTRIYHLVCTGDGLGGQDSVTFNVIPPPPTVDLKCTGNTGGAHTDGPCTLDYNTAGTVYWTTTNADECFVTYGGYNDEWDTNGSISTGNRTSSITYDLTCNGASGSATDHVTFNVNPPPLAVDILCTDAQGGPKDGPCSVAYNGSATLSWTATNCTTLAIDQGIGNVTAPGSRSTGQLTATTTYKITCTGIAGTIYDYVTVGVGTDWTLSCTPATLPLMQTDTGSYQFNTAPLGNFNYPVSFSGPTYVGQTPANAPSVQIVSNGHVPGDGRTTSALVTTNANTSVGTFTLRFSGTGNGITHTCDVDLVITALPPPPLAVDILCTDSQGGPKDGPCSVPYNGSATLSWTSSNCTSLTVDHGISPVNNPNGSASTGPLTATTTYKITCTGIAGTIYDYVTIGVGSDWTLSCTPPTLPLVAGSAGSITFNTAALGGYSSTIHFTGPTFGGAEPSNVSYVISDNDKVPGTNPKTNVLITTFSNTSPGTYTLTFTGVGNDANSITHSCDISLQITAPPPAVDIKCTDAQGGPTDGPCSVPYNGSATLSWTSNNCNISLSIDQGIGGVTPAGSRSTGNLQTSKTYTITCVGTGGTRTDSVTVNVGSDWTLSCTPPTLPLVQGQSGSFQFNTGALGGFNYTVSFTGPTYPNGTPANPPVVQIFDNNHVPGDGTTTSALVTTDSTTSVGTFTLRFTGVGNGITHSCDVSLQVTQAPPPTGPTVDIKCKPAAFAFDACDVAPGQNIRITWTSANITSGSCTMDKNGVSLGTVADNSGNNYFSGPTNVTTTFTITCQGLPNSNPAFATDSVTLTVPTVDIKCTDSQGGPKDGPCSVPYNGNADLSWTSSSCSTLSIDQGIGNVAVPSGSRNTGALTSTKTYTLTCTNATGNVIITDSVTVSVGSDWGLTCTPPTITLVQGQSDNYTFNTSSLGGFSSSIHFTGPAYPNGAPAVAPQVQILDNDKVPGTTPKTTALVSTSINTSVGTFTLRFTGVGGGITHTCDVDLVISAAPPPPIAADINCSDASHPTPFDGPCTVNSGSAATLSWTSSNCNISLSIDQGIGSVAASGSVSTGPLTSSKTYTITCTGAAGTTHDSVTVGVGTDWALSCAPPTITVQQGQPGSYTFTTSSLGGFSGSIHFTGPTYPNGAPAVGPQVTISNNDQVVETLPKTTALITTTTSTSVGTFTLRFTGVGGGITHTCDVDLIVTAAPQPASVDLKCTDAQGGPKDACSVVSNGSATLSWTASNCDISLSIDQGIGSVTAPGSRSTGSIASTKTYTISCTGSGGSAQDSVTISVSASPDWAMNCTPLTLPITQGNTDSYTFTTVASNGFSSSIHIVGPDYNGAPPAIPPTVQISNNDQLPGAIPKTTALIVTTTSTSTGTYTLTFKGTGGGIEHGCNVQLVINPAPVVTPNPPTITSTDNSNCDNITVNWTPGATPPSVTGFTVYQSSSSSSGPWTDISGLLGSSTHSFIHSKSNSTPPGSTNYYKVRAWNGAVFADSNPSSVISVIVCEPKLNKSDKDVTQVVGQINKTFASIPCSGTSEAATLPNNALFSINDGVTFQINVCNSGPGALTGVTVVDTLSNLSNPTTATASPADCVTSQNYDPASKTISFGLANIAGAPSGGTNLCSITFTATVTAPTGSNPSAVYRFQNSAKIYANEITANPTKYPNGYYFIATPPYLFYGSAGSAPNRNEAAP